MSSSPGSTAQSLHSSNIDLSKFSAKEREEIETLQSIMSSRGSSNMQRDIAEAKLDDLVNSKEPEPHNRRHRIVPLEETGGDSRIFSKDEAFERYEMGGHNDEHKGSKNLSQGEGDFYAVKNNHKASGHRKASARDDYLEEGVTDTREA
ncbi:hypothetical protein CPB84DRAFT_1765152 [Gymnopilus junonius]|uniref:Uncharacterized protein n=1 Tax=Gymnopilus junonius TaxID=109634 RepID=A0A9P5TSK9_GYMJU|nr:hypothetical protein CPB84DRAFT_1765152 [Gymnopilus junonius]